MFGAPIILDRTASIPVMVVNYYGQGNRLHRSRAIGLRRGTCWETPTSTMAFCLASTMPLNGQRKPFGERSVGTRWRRGPSRI